MMVEKSRSKAPRTARIGVFSALYVVTSLIPISIFIGAPSFLALNLIITPTMAILLHPIEAFSASLIGGLIGLYVAPTQAMFGAFTILLPVAGATFGSIALHKGKTGCLIAGAFLISSILAYLIRNHPFPFFISPHLIAFGLVTLTSLKRMTPLKVRVPIYAFISTMCEQGMMMIFAVHLLGLPWQVFPGILPLMIYERVMGTVGSSLVILGIMRFAPHYFEPLIVDHGLKETSLDYYFGLKEVPKIALITACGEKKDSKPMEAHRLYRSSRIKAVYNRRGMSDMYILSSEYGLVGAKKIIEPYDRIMDEKLARELVPSVMDKLRNYDYVVFFNGGSRRAYLSCIKETCERLNKPLIQVGYARTGGVKDIPRILRLLAMKNWDGLRGINHTEIFNLDIDFN